MPSDLASEENFQEVQIRVCVHVRHVDGSYERMLGRHDPMSES